jgi:hypothetical protein
MTTLTAKAEITSDGMLKIELPCQLAPGPVEVLIVIQPRHAASPAVWRNWDEIYGLGREVWQGVDAKAYVEELRQERGGV